MIKSSNIEQVTNSEIQEELELNENLIMAWQIKQIARLFKTIKSREARTQIYQLTLLMSSLCKTDKSYKGNVFNTKGMISKHKKNTS